MRVTPATGTGIKNGVLDGTYSGNIATLSKSDEGAIMDEVYAQVPFNADFTFIMYVFPENSDHIIGGAWAQLPGYVSAYDYRVVSDVTFTVSEFTMSC